MAVPNGIERVLPLLLLVERESINYHHHHRHLTEAEAWLAQRFTTTRYHHSSVARMRWRQNETVHFPLLSLASDGLAWHLICSHFVPVTQRWFATDSWQHEQRGVVYIRIRNTTLPVSGMRFVSLQFSAVEGDRVWPGKIWQIMTFSCYWMVKILLQWLAM